MREVYVIRDLWNNYGDYEEYESGMEVYGIFDDFQKAKEAVIMLVNDRLYGPSKTKLLITPESTFEMDSACLDCAILYFGVDDDSSEDEEYCERGDGHSIYRHEIDIVKVPINRIEMDGYGTGAL